IGRSGAGKTTLLNVLAGRLNIDSGDIVLNGQPMTSLANDSWYSNLAYIPQQPYIFPMSLKDNLRFYEPSAPDSLIESVVEQIGLKEFVDALPQGLEEKIGEGGRAVSGGQAQRIALARALVSEKEIILLDEPTAHLDIETEYEVKQLIVSIFKKRTDII